MQFTLVTYNMHKGIGGVDRRYRLERIVETISHCEPDIVCLQEVDDGVPRSRADRQVDLLAEKLDLPHHAFQRNVSLRTGHYGNAILSRFPLFDIEDLELTIRFKKRRRALCCHCRIPVDGHVRTLLLYNTHLGLAGFERQIQLKRILESEPIQHTRRTTPVIAAGDFNDVWGRLGKSLLEPAGFSSASQNTKTFPAAFPVRALDYIFFRGPLQLVHCFASRTKIAKQASDHLPLVAKFKIEPSSDRA